MDINGVYEYLISNDSITTRKLNGLGYNAKSINDLIEKKILKRIARGYYQISNLNNLYGYGKKLIAQKEYSRAYECFARCYKINPNHMNTCFQLFVRAIENGQYDEVFKYLEGFYGKGNEYQQRDYDFYLLLLSNITILPDKYQQYIRFLKYENIKIEDGNMLYSDTKAQNNMRLNAFNHKFVFAYHQANIFIHQDGKIMSRDVTIEKLLYKILQIEKSNKNEVLSYIEAKEYQKIIDLLSNKKILHPLSLIDEYSLKLAKINLEISKGNKVQVNHLDEAANVFDAIDKGDYKLALKLSNSYNLTNNIDGSDSVLYLLLRETVKSISVEVDEESLKTGTLKNAVGTSNLTESTHLDTKVQSYVCEVIDSKDLIILEPMDRKTRAIVHKMINMIPDVVSFSIGEEPERRVVLKYKEPQNGYINYKALIEEINDYFYAQKYNACIDELKHFMSILDKPKPFVFYKLGECYFKKGDKKQALKYFEISQELNKQESNNYDLRQLVAYLKAEICDEVDNIEEIKSLVFYYGKSIEEACKDLNAKTEDIPLIMLKIAEYLYIYGISSEADKLVCKAEKLKNKTPAFERQYLIIQARKKFYKNGEHEPELLPTTLKLHPRRK